MLRTDEAIVFLVLFTIGSVLAIILQCKPVAAAYDFTLMEHAKCYPIDTFVKIGVFNSGECSHLIPPCPSFSC